LKSKTILPIFIAASSLVSALLLAYIYLILPLEDVINRQLLFGITFQIWGIIATVLVVREILYIRDNQRWQAVNSHVFNFLYLKIYAALSEMFAVFKVKLDVKESPRITKLGIEYMNPKAYEEWKKKVIEELKKIEKDGSEPIEKNMFEWQPSTHKEFSRIMADLKDYINELLNSYPHQIPPDFLAKIIDVRERAYGLSNQSLMFSDKEVVEKLGFEYQKMHDSMMKMESGFVLDLVSKILKLLEILDKNVDLK
jgi:hypothetical protein